MYRIYKIKLVNDLNIQTFEIINFSKLIMKGYILMGKITTTICQ